MPQDLGNHLLVDAALGQKAPNGAAEIVERATFDACPHHGLVERDPILAKKLQKVWGTPKAFMDTPPPKPDQRNKAPKERPKKKPA